MAGSDSPCTRAGTSRIIIDGRPAGASGLAMGVGSSKDEGSLGAVKVGGGGWLTCAVGDAEVLWKYWRGCSKRSPTSKSTQAAAIPTHNRTIITLERRAL